MDLQRSKAVLKKINNLIDSFSEDEAISSIERDLLMSYTRQFYELLSMQEGDTTPTKPAPKVSKVKPRPAPKAKKEVPYTPPKKVTIPESITTMEEEIIDIPAPPPAPTPPPPTPPKQTAKPVTGKLKKIFEFKEPKELSERLSLTPIKDLTKALAINDRLLYVSQLFDNQQTTFTETLNRLNALSSYEEAVQVLSSFAAENNWTDGDKIETATEFAKLVKRRYK